MHKKILVTGSAGHLGEALILTLRERGVDCVGLDVLAAPTTHLQGSISDANLVNAAMQGVDAVVHTATLHKPHVATHTRQQFVDVNITGTLNLLEAAVRHHVKAFVFTSTTSAFGDSLKPQADEPATWITEAVRSIPKNIYGVTKLAAENLCQLFHRNSRLPVVVLRTSRFFPEPDDDEERRSLLTDDNLKALEFLYRRVELDDVVSAHFAALERAQELGFDRFIISAKSPFLQSDLSELRTNLAQVLSRRVPGYEESFARLGWKLLPDVDRVYVSDRAIERLGWKPRADFAAVLSRVLRGGHVISPLAQKIGTKGYHQHRYKDGIYPVGM